MSFGYSQSIREQKSYSSQREQSKNVQCPRCRTYTAESTSDGIYVCTRCHYQLTDHQDLFIDIEQMSQGGLLNREIRLSQSRVKAEVSLLKIAESLQLIMAFQTIYAGKILGIDLSASMYYFLDKFTVVITPPVDKDTFIRMEVLLLSSILKTGIPATHLDIVKWIMKGEVPYYDPVSYLPHSFSEMLNEKELKILQPPIFSLSNFFLVSKNLSLRVYPLPCVYLVFWRCAGILGLPEREFTQFCATLLKDHRIKDYKEIQTILSEGTEEKLFKHSKLLRVGFATPIAIALYALVFIYRLDGTDWIHSYFHGLGFPSLKTVFYNILKLDSLDPQFPAINGDFSTIHYNIITHLRTAPELLSHFHYIINDVREGFSKNCEIIYNVDSISDLNNDMRVILRCYSNILGIPQLLIVQQFSKISRKRFGYNLIRTTSDN